MNLDPKYINALNLTVGPHRVRRVLKRFGGSAERAWAAPTSTLTSKRASAQQREALARRRKMTDPNDAWNELARHGVAMVALNDDAYPPLLRETAAPPLALYVRGNKDALLRPSVAIVGTRSASSYGTSVLPGIVQGLVQAGICVVSGLAQGIDACAHTATLEHNGTTVGVLGCGLHKIYPLLNKKLGEAVIAQKGAIISEYPLHTPPLKQHFPARNRVIAGMALGTLVVESRKKGGALITAQRALEENREVFALPGPVNQPASVGTNELIQAGAKLVMNADDILEELPIKTSGGAQQKLDLSLLSDTERAVVTSLEAEPLHIDKIIKHVTLPAAEVNAVITMLELKGIIQNTGGNTYQRLL